MILVEAILLIDGSGTLHKKVPKKDNLSCKYDNQKNLYLLDEQKQVSERQVKEIQK